MAAREGGSGRRISPSHRMHGSTGIASRSIAECWSGIWITTVRSGLKGLCGKGAHYGWGRVHRPSPRRVFAQEYRLAFDADRPARLLGESQPTGRDWRGEEFPGEVFLS